MSLAGQGDRKMDGVESVSGFRQAEAGGMIQPGMAIEGRVGWVPRKHTQLMVEQNHRQG